MTLVARYANHGGAGWGLIEDDQLFPADEDVALVEALADNELLQRVSKAKKAPIPLDEVSLLAPMPDPPQFLGVGLNYRDHAAEAGMEIPTDPVTFGLYKTSIIGDGDTIEMPPFSDENDWEAELGIVIGSGGRDIPEEDALGHVGGYTIINDVTARDIQMSEGQWGRSKSFDTFKPMGPWIVTPDVLGDASDLSISLWVNDDLKQSSHTSELIFSVTQIVSLLSRSTTLLPGTVITTGTPHGVGFSRTPPEFLKDGDTVSIEIEGIGRLSNPVAAAGSET